MQNVPFAPVTKETAILFIATQISMDRSGLIRQSLDIIPSPELNFITSLLTYMCDFPPLNLWGG